MCEVLESLLCVLKRCLKTTSRVWFMRRLVAMHQAGWRYRPTHTEEGDHWPWLLEHIVISNAGNLCLVNLSRARKCYCQIEEPLMYEVPRQHIPCEEVHIACGAIGFNVPGK